MGKQNPNKYIDITDSVWRAVIEQLHDHIMLVDAEGRILYINRTTSDYEVDATLNTSMYDYLSEVDAQTVRMCLSRVARTGEPGSYEVEYQGLDGVISYFESTISPVKQSGASEIFSVVARDITARKQAEKLACEREENLDALTRNAGEGILVIQDGKPRFANSRALEILGYSHEELLDTGIADLLPEGWDEDRPIGGGKQLSSQPSSQTFESVMTAKGGDIVFVQVSISQTRWQGRPADLILFDDLGEVKRAAAALQRANENLEHVLRMSAAVMYVARTSGNYGATYISENVKTELGYEPSQFTDDPEFWMSKIHPDDREQVLAGLSAVGNRDYYTHEYRLLHRDGTYRWSHDALRVVRDKHGRPVELVGAWIDISARRRMEEELREARDQAQAANQSKSDFLAIVGHELRSPLGVILGMTRLVLRSQLSDLQRTDLETVERAGQELVRIIDDILDYSRLERGEIRIEKKPFNLPELLMDVYQAFWPKASAKGLEIKVNYPSDLPNTLMGDPGRIRQIVANLVDNALKFTHEGHIDILVAIEAETEHAETLKFIVKDTGVGIPEERCAEIFEKFNQANGSVSRRYGGVGLGLTISRELVERMGGDIGVTSNYGQGSTFWFTLPLPAVEEAAVSISASDRELSAGMPPRILIVENEQAHRTLLARLLEEVGCGADFVADGGSALQKLANRYDLIITDVSMPDISGFDLVERIRQKGSINADTMVVAMTACKTDDGRKECRRVGVDLCLEKPLHAEMLRELIEGRSGLVREG